MELDVGVVRGCIGTHADFAEGCLGTHVGNSELDTRVYGKKCEIWKSGFGVIAEFRGSVGNWEFTNYSKGLEGVYGIM